jgi:hypothetical protein
MPCPSKRAPLKDQFGGSDILLVHSLKSSKNFKFFANYFFTKKFANFACLSTTNITVICNCNKHFFNFDVLFGLPRTYNI